MAAQRTDFAHWLYYLDMPVLSAWLLAPGLERSMLSLAGGDGLPLIAVSRIKATPEGL
jgi:hypothetical protein